ncbi:TonB-dependent receptor domain-containing protein [Marinomonas ostreistagni]|uniref:TonB-dependent receptor domain-containing protein n=1 Tax=Marinomonas ostreistagni TaxID=359209 RepID=UPI00194F414E|nr:TonB-dependent receptor [Marinomonas ostreistagni]MBM6550949.1 TonB-dependent receptor [Marinomonas ostreistagni]
MKRSMIAVAVALASGTLYADEQLDTLVVESTQETELQTTDKARVSEAHGATTITSEDIEAVQASNLADALQNNASIQIDEVGGSRGSEITVRGQSGKAVSVRVEGAPNNRSQIMHKGSADRDTIWLNMDMYESITVIPGAAANTYGNGSTGGVLLLETKDPESIIREGRDWGANLRYSHETNGEANGISADVAKKFNDKFSANATISAKDTKAYEDANGYETNNGSTGSEDLSYLVKGVFTPDEEQRLEASILENHMEYSDFDDDGSETKKENKDQTLSAQYTYNPKDNDLVDLKIRLSRSDGDQETDNGTGDWEENGGVTTTYAEIENTSVLFPTSNTMHIVRYGLDYTFDDIRMIYSNDDGSAKVAERTSIGGYLSDTIHIGEGLELAGSLRYDQYDASFNSNDIEGDGSLNSKLSALWKPFEDTSIHGLGFTALVGSGYRSPAIYEIYGKGFPEEPFSGSDVNGDGIYETGNLTGCMDGHGNWCVIPNENLTGETSLNSEIGLTFERMGVWQAQDRVNASMTYIHNDLKDKIYNDTLGTLDQNLGTYNGRPYEVRRFVNKDEAAVFGWELTAGYDSEFLFAKFSFQDMAGYVVEDDGSKTKDNNMVPRSVSVTLGTYFNDQKGRVGVDTKYRKGRKYESTFRGNTRTVEYNSYTVYDVFASYQFTDNFSAQLRVDNVTDELYSKSQTSTDDSTGADTTSYQPGRNFKLGLNYRF